MGAVKSIGNIGGGLLGNLTGTGSNSGIMGTGQYRSDMYNADPNAFAPDANEQGFIKALQGQAYGTAPSAAQLQMQQGINQATGQAQALAASQRGINPALAARLAAQSQASLAQQGNAQAGILRAQEQQQGLGMLGGEMQSVRQGRENYQGLQSQNYNQNNMANERGYESAAGHRADAMGGLMNSFGGSMMGGGGGGGGMGGMMAHGGIVPQRFAGGGDVFSLPSYSNDLGPGGMNYQSYDKSKSSGGGGGGGGGLMSLVGLAAMAAHGGKVPGKAPVSGDSLKNDKVPAMLSPGEAVIPRSIMNGDNPGEQAKEFVEQLKRHKERMKGQAPSYAKVLKMHRDLGDQIEKLCKGGKV